MFRIVAEVEADSESQASERLVELLEEPDVPYIGVKDIVPLPEGEKE